MFSLAEYVGVHEASPDWTEERAANAERLRAAVVLLMERLCRGGVEFRINPATDSLISGATYGGFRPQDCPQGAPHSSHKEGLAVDLYDPQGNIDRYLEAHPELLEQFGIYIEHPDRTPHWSHWSIKAPGSGKHIFYP